MKIITPAKVNLYLRIVGKRDDGYHLIDSWRIGDRGQIKIGVKSTFFG